MYPARPRAPLLVLLVWLWPLIAAAQIYRYQDEYGAWHFTDDPPVRYESSVVPDIATSPKKGPRDTESTEDLEARLRSAFNPITPIAYATLAVVSIRTNSGEGSGFFCSEEGYILTNKHVVHPDSTEVLAERDRSHEDQEQKLRAIKASLKEARSQLRLMKQDLTGYEELIEETRDDETRAWAKNAHARLSQRYRAERGRISTMERSVRTLQSDLRSSKRELDHQRRFATAGKRFEVVLKDGTELDATLVKVSDDQDLALLKLDGYRTPFLDLDPSGLLSQGTRVLAIGNPLGMQDAVTSGVVTQITPEYLLTDAQILPGSSGGPLIRESGAVIGINVARKVAAGTPEYAAGFGKVIPIALALDAFPTELASSAIQALDPARSAYPGPIQPEDYGLVEHGIDGAGLQPRLDSGQPANIGSARGEISDTAAVRLIVSDDDRASDLDDPVESEPRSLDFPPEGSGVFPPGISLTPE